MRKLFQKIIRFSKNILPFFFSPPSLPFLISSKDKKDSEFEKFKQDLIDILILFAIFITPFLLFALFLLGLALCLYR
jgi:hypothetical protein